MLAVEEIDRLNPTPALRHHLLEGTLTEEHGRRSRFCTKCGRFGISEEFYPHYPRCKECRAASYRENRQQIIERAKRWHAEHPDYQSEYQRKKWQRSGRGVHMARCADWVSFFDSLGNDTERTVAAYVMLALAPLDTGTYTTIKDRSFDYNYIGAYTNI